MLLYLSSNENIGIFDFLFDEHSMIIKKLSGTFSLKQFVIYDMRSLNHYSYVAIDIKALKDTESDIMEAVIAFNKMFSSRVIFYIEDVINNQQLIVKLIEEGIYNIVTAEEVKALKNEILKSTSDLGMSKREIQTKIMQNGSAIGYSEPEYSFVNKNTKIAVTGVSHKVGTTTMAINLANYLASVGATVCYVEANDYGHLMQLPTMYERMTINEDSLTYNDVKYLTLNAECHDDFDFIVYDMGVVDTKIINAIRTKCELAVLCATAKPYEIEAYERTIQLFDSDTINTILSFVPEPAKVKLQSKYGQVYFSKYAPDLFDGETNQTIWESLLEAYIIKNTM